MQDMTFDICRSISNTSDNQQLIDERDGKVYYVNKLADGNCWMTQNLDYDDPASTRVTSVSGTNGGPGTDWKNESDMRQYWDPGEMVVSGAKLSTATSSTDKHLLVGNYYSYSSATKGTGNGVTAAGANASDSICPNGWQLPTSNSSNSGSFGKLQVAGSIGSTGSKLNEAPYYFQYGGYVLSGNLSNAGTFGYYWSSTASDVSKAYLLQFTSSSVSPSNNLNRYLGMSVRCLVLGS